MFPVTIRYCIHIDWVATWVLVASLDSETDVRFCNGHNIIILLVAF